MSQIEKLINRLLIRPKDFTYDELKQFLNYFGFEECKKGKTSGSRVQFLNNKNQCIELHKPHPDNIIKEYKLKEIINQLVEWEMI